jgi:hypothetical protein
LPARSPVRSMTPPEACGLLRDLRGPPPFLRANQKQIVNARAMRGKAKCCGSQPGRYNRAIV